MSFWWPKRVHKTFLKAEETYNESYIIGQNRSLIELFQMRDFGFGGCFSKFCIVGWIALQKNELRFIIIKSALQFSLPLDPCLSILLTWRNAMGSSSLVFCVALRMIKCTAIEKLNLHLSTKMSYRVFSLSRFCWTSIIRRSALLILPPVSQLSSRTSFPVWCFYIAFLG